MKLILERSQREGGLMSKTVTFSLSVRAEIAQAERDAINKYRLADDVLFSDKDVPDAARDPSLRGIAAALMHRATVQLLRVRDLVNGKTFECKDLGEMIGTEEQIRRAAQNLKMYLDVAATFGGREVVEL